MKGFFSTVFILLFTCFASNAAAQQIPDYLFLEVLDSKGKPVVDAKVIYPMDGFSGSGGTQKTDSRGAVRLFFPGNRQENGLISFFTVSKEGYFDYFDFGGSHRRQGGNEATIELLKIPENDEDKRINGNEQTKREFLWAAKTGDSKTVKKMLKSGMDPNLSSKQLRGIAGPENVSAIEFAVDSADSETVRTLINAGVKIRSAEGPMRRLLVNYLEADPFRWHKFKSENERKEILRTYQEGVRVLLKAGADFKIEDSQGRKPIILAANKGYPLAVKILLDKGFSPNLMDDKGETLLMHAAGFTFPVPKTSKVETVKMLLDLGADPNLSKDGCASAIREAAVAGDAEVIRELVKRGAKINRTCANGHSALAQAIERGYVEAARTLIEAGADIKAKHYRGETFLMIAAEKRNPEMVLMLIEKGFPVDMKGAEGWTALISAVTNGWPNLDIVRLLLKAGANPNVVADEVNYLDGCSTPLRNSIMNRETEAARILVENGADVNLACRNGDTALVYAIGNHQAGVVSFLISLGADVRGERIDKALNFIRPLGIGGYERPEILETIRIVEQARVK